MAKQAWQGANVQTIRLNDQEQEAPTRTFPSITTVTFYDAGTDAFIAATHQLRERVRSIVIANPWLAGWLEKDHDGVLLKYQNPPLRPDCTTIMGFEELTLHASDRLGDLRGKMSKIDVKAGSALIDKPHEALFKVIVVATTSGFALVLSISHMVGDGRTFYSIYKMLDPSQKVYSLNAERKVSSVGAAAELTQDKVSGSFWFALGVLRSLMFPRPVMRQTYEINSDAMETAKKQHSGAFCLHSLDSDAAPHAYVSSNDVLTSAIFRSLNKELNIMAVDMRSHWDGLDGTIAGNYAAGVWFFDAREYQQPGDIRRALVPALRTNKTPKLCRSGQPSPSATPGWYTQSRGRNTACITNWATFYHDVQFSGCTQINHLPVVQDAFFEAGAVIYRPSGSRLAVMVCARTAADMSAVEVALRPLTSPP